jgi:hypothetical protein
MYCVREPSALHTQGRHAHIGWVMTLSWQTHSLLGNLLGMFWLHVPCTVQLPVDWHSAVIGPPPVLHVPLHTVPAAAPLPQAKLPPVGASGLPVHTESRRDIHAHKRV